MAHLRELGDLVKAATVISVTHGSPLPSLSQEQLTKLLKFVWLKCQSYPESGDISSKTWKKILKYLLQPPKASPSMILACQTILQALQISETGTSSKTTPVSCKAYPPPYENDSEQQKKPIIGAVDPSKPSNPSLPTAHTPRLQFLNR